MIQGYHNYLKLPNHLTKTIERITGCEQDTNGKWWYKTTKGKISADELIKKIS